jgi:hypothetical protein
MSFPNTPGRNWSTGGRGGTLNAAGDGPGPYYALAKRGADVVQVGASGGWASGDVNVRAVRGGVLSIQRALNRAAKRTGGAPVIEVTGRYDRPTADLVKWFQGRTSPDATGVVDIETARVLFTGEIQRICDLAGLADVTWGVSGEVAMRPWQVVWGVINMESLFDPGSVGYVDPTDLGLAQINGGAHPDWSERERLAAPLAIDFVIDYLEDKLAALDGRLRDAVAAYNLGLGGVQSWISDGRPDIWKGRDVKHYIDSILLGYAGWSER